MDPGDLIALVALVVAIAGTGVGWWSAHHAKRIADRATEIALEHSDVRWEVEPRFTGFALHNVGRSDAFDVTVHEPGAPRLAGPVRIDSDAEIFVPYESARDHLAWLLESGARVELIGRRRGAQLEALDEAWNWRAGEGDEEARSAKAQLADFMGFATFDVSDSPMLSWTEPPSAILERHNTVAALDFTVHLEVQWRSALGKEAPTAQLAVSFGPLGRDVEALRRAARQPV